MKKMKLSAIVAAALIAGSALGMTGAPAVAMSAAHMAEVQQMQATAQTAQAAILASPTELKAMQTAIAMQSAGQARTILLRHGFTVPQMQVGIIVFSHSMLPKKVQPGQYFYIEIDHKPFKISVHALP
jgi:hypothetical protein